MLAWPIFTQHKHMCLICWSYECNNFPNAASAFSATDHFSELLTYRHFVQHMLLTNLSGVSHITEATLAIQIVPLMSISWFELSRKHLSLLYNIMWRWNMGYQQHKFLQNKSQFSSSQSLFVVSKHWAKGDRFGRSVMPAYMI